MIEQRVTLRYGAQQIPAIVQAVQGDTGRDVIFELADYEIPAGATANYYIDKPDGNAIYNSAEVISSTEILAHLTEQALAVPGRNNGQVRILNDGEVITSFDFVLEVEAFRGILRLQSETEVNIFDEALHEAAEDAIEEIQAQTPVVTGMQNSIAPSYSSSSTYAVGDYVMYNAQLYKCFTAITTAEAWTAEHWTPVPLSSDVKNLKSAIDTVITVSDTLNDINFSEYTVGLASGIFRNEKIYPEGFVESITGKIVDDSTQSVILVFIDPETNLVINSWYFTDESGIFVMPLNIVMDKPFSIGVYCMQFASRVNQEVNAYRTTISSAPVGADVTGTNVGPYELGIKVTYKDLNKRFAESVTEDNEHSIIYAQNTLDTFVNSILSGWWWTEYQYAAGYIDHVTLKAPSNGSGGKCGVMIIDAVSNVCLFIVNDYVFGDNLLAVIPVHLYANNPVYIACMGAAYLSTGGSVRYARYMGAYPTVGETVQYTWVGSASYKFGVQVTYASLSKNYVRKCKARRRMFICGDSITAGYPYNMNPVIPGLRYGDAIGRTLDYDVTFGAQSGNGWLYSTGSAYAYSITNETDFSQFDVALYAWGTNDFYHDKPLGDINDQYSDQTVCGVINYCIDKIYTDNPAIVLIISTPLNRTYDNGYGYEKQNAQGYTLLDMANKMIELCRSRGIAYIDNLCSPFNPKSLSGLTGDGLHPNRVGYQVLGAYMASKVSGLIQPYVSSSDGL